MGRHAIPDRWLNYTPIGKIIEGTRFIAFKVPLRQQISETAEDIKTRLDTKTLLKDIPNLGLIIDLTNTNRYYDPLESFEKNGVNYIKIMVPGHTVPDSKYRNLFKRAVEEFLQVNQDNDKLIGVHCTHGVNRTGFLICNYMVREMNIEPKDALEKFAKARGHPIERTNYTEFISANAISNKTFIRSADQQNNQVPLTNYKYTYNNESRMRNSRRSPYNRPAENWRSEPPPPGTEDNTYLSWRRRPSITNPDSERTETNRNYNYLTRQSNERSNDQFHSKRINYRNDEKMFEHKNDVQNRTRESNYRPTARRDNSSDYSRESHSSTYSNSSKFYEKPISRFNGNSRSNYRTENSKDNFEKDSRSSNYYNYDERRDNKPQFNSSKRPYPQRTSMLDDLY